MIITPQNPIIAAQIVNILNLYSIAGGAGVGILASVIRLCNNSKNSDTFTDIITGVGGGAIGQALTFYMTPQVTKPGIPNDPKRIWFYQTPLPAVCGAASVIGIRLLISSLRD
ncbi:MAG: hypothetical protein AAGG81_01845 [Chlamydiota bacterium]